MQKDEQLSIARNEQQQIIDACKHVGVSFGPIKKSYNKIFKDREKNTRSLDKAVESVSGVPITKGLVTVGSSLAEFDLNYSVSLNKNVLKKVCTIIQQNQFIRENVDLTPQPNAMLQQELSNLDTITQFLHMPIDMEHITVQLEDKEKIREKILSERTVDKNEVARYAEMLQNANDVSESIEKKKMTIDLIENSGTVSTKVKNKLIAKLEKTIKRENKKYEKVMDAAEKFKQETSIGRHLSNVENYQGLFDAVKSIRFAV